MLWKRFWLWTILCMAGITYWCQINLASSIMYFCLLITLNRLTKSWLRIVTWHDDICCYYFLLCAVLFFEILKILQVCACCQGCQNDIMPESIMLLLYLYVQRIGYTVSICFRSTFPCFEAQISECWWCEWGSEIEGK